jgi:hypothetical protein
MKKNIFIFLVLLLHSSCFCQHTVVKNDSAKTDSATDYYIPNVIMRYEDMVYDKNIKSVQLHNEQFELSQPLLQLGSDNRLQLSFDDLSGNLKNYSFTLIHCNANWQPSKLMPIEYIDGYQEMDITDFNYSENTLQKYIHYNAYIPSPYMHITKSGNYILKVYDRDAPDQPVITKRLLFFTPKIIITAQAKAASIIEDRNFKQEIDFIIDKGQYTINDPFEDLKVFILQNNRWDNASKDLKPTFIKDTQLVYNYDEENVFTGGNEFRAFDTKSLKYKAEHVAKIRVDSSRTSTDVFLLPDEKRTYIKYTSGNDINGNFVIRTIDGNGDSAINADYCRVHFFLSYNEVLTNGDLYVFGAFNGWKCTKENRMKYNAERLGYEAVLYLKQGYYNYEYGFLENGKTAVDETLIEGMHFETENEYTIYVYYQQQGVYYDQLIGVGHINSAKN